MQSRISTPIIVCTFVFGFALGAVALSSQSARAYFWNNQVNQLDKVASVTNWAGYTFRDNQGLKADFTAWARKADFKEMKFRSDLDYQIAFDNFLYAKIKAIEAKLNGNIEKSNSSTFKLYKR